MGFRMGIDIGGTNVRAGILDGENEVISKYSINIHGIHSEKEILESVCICARMSCAKAGITPDDVSAIGIGIPGAVDCQAKTIKSAANLPFNNTFLGNILKPDFQAKVCIANDANAAALGEAVKGTGRGSSSFAMITLGTGVGGGIVINGKIYEGCNGLAGEIGHIIINKKGRRCKCGQKGCLEAYASGSALLKDTKKAMLAERTSLMWKLAGTLEQVTGETPFEAKKHGDKTAEKVIEQYSRSLACGIISIIHVLQPEVISIGGGISRQGEYILEPVRKMVFEMSNLKKTSYMTKLHVAELGADAGMIGAAMLGD